MQLSANFTEEIVKHVQRIVRGVEPASTEAAKQLVRLGVTQRRSILPRGTLESSAPNRLPFQNQLSEVIACLKNAQGDFLSSLMAVLSEWGDGQAIVALQRRMETTSKIESRTWRCYIHSVMCIGGPQAVQILLNLEKDNSFGIAAKWALDELITGGCVDWSEGYGPDQLERLTNFYKANK